MMKKFTDFLIELFWLYALFGIWGTLIIMELLK